jgi:ABC-2 type transport system permease protein
MSMWGQTLYGSGWATGQDRELGTLEPTLSAPTPYLWVVLGRVVWNTVSGLIGGAIVYVVVLASYGHPLSVANPLGFLAMFVFVIVTLAAVGIVFAAWYVYTRYAGFVQNVGEFAFYVGTGCMFPVILLPFWTNPISLAFPPTWAVDALRYVSVPGYQGFSWGLWGDIVGAVATTAVYLAVAGTVFHRVEKHVLETGNLSEW